MNDNQCEYCCQGWKPLFRIIDSYSYGEEIDFFNECETCDRGAGIGETYDMEEVCNNCEHKPYQPESSLNLTIAIVDGALMFEDKHMPFDMDWKRFIDIKFCPMCGRDFDSDRKTDEFIEKLREFNDCEVKSE